MQFGCIRWLATAALACAATGAQAEWLKATSRHFQIYSNTSTESINALATKLEQVDGALRRISGIKDGNETAANPVTVYVLESPAEIQRLIRSDNVAGFYVGRANGAVAFTPRRSGDGQLDPQLVLFHEYAHHFLLGQSNVAYPAWLSEGYAEFVATARFPKDGVQIGAAAQHRAYGLLDAAKLPITTLFAPGPKLTGIQTDQIYGRGWLLTHYLIFGGTREGQLATYLSALDAGMPPLDAAQKGFGDLKQLDRELDAYLRKSKISAMTIGSARLPQVSIAVRQLTPGERALIPMRIVSTRGVDGKTAKPLYTRAAAAAAAYPGDAVAQGWLAEMAYDAGDDAGAEAAADRALAADPKSVQALLYKANIRLRPLVSASAPASDKRWGEARSWIIKANRVDPDAAGPLVAFYDSFQAAKAPPSKSAIVGIHRALELAPQDDGLRFRSARQFLVDGKADEAKRTLRPLAFSPHAPTGNPAARLIAMLDKGATGPAALAVLDAEAELENAKAGKGGKSTD